MALPFTAAASLQAAKEPSLITGENKSYGYSWKQEMQLGAEADQDMVSNMGLYDNPQLQAYVQAVGERILQHSHFANPQAPQIYKDTKFTFRIIDSPVVNAFALPGGFVYVTRGLLSHLQNEAQLAVVLGHEIAHVGARHSSQQAQRGKWGQIGVIAGAILGQTVLGNRMPNIGETVLGAGSKATEMFLLKYSRDAEHESDNLGVSWATRAGYAAGESSHFFHTLKTLNEDKGKSLPTWQSTHPDPGDRAQRVVQLANAAPPGSATNVGEGEYLRHIEGIIVGDDPRAGFAQDGTFYHPTLRFQMPVASGWKLDNQASAVIMAEPSGKALMGLRLAPGGRAKDAAAQFAQQNKIQVSASGDTVVNGLPATVIVGQAATEQGNVGVWNAFVEMEGKVYSLLGYSPAQVFEQMRPTFESVAAGFSPLRVPEVASVQPTRLKLVRADRNAPLASFVPTSLPAEVTAESVANLNQMKLDQPVPEGKTLKVPDAPARPSFSRPTPANQSRWNNRTQAQHPNTQYPNQPAPYPPQAGQYPNQQGYPAQNYPPGQYPQGQYPQSGGYPATSNPNYPPQNQYPQQNYPQAGNPAGNYPPQGANRYPSNNRYPPQNYPPQNPPQGYPQQGYPQQNYPQGGYPPQNYPQQSPPPQQPAWPR